MSADVARWPDVVRERLVRAFTQRLGLKLSSLFLALVLWVVASVQEPTVASIPVRVVPDLVHTRLDAPLPAVTAIVTGRGREVLKLLRTPPVLRVAASSDDGDSVTRVLSPGEVDLPPGSQVLVREIRPHQMTLHLVAQPRIHPAALRARDSAADARDSIAAHAGDSLRIDSAARVIVQHRDSIHRDSVRRDSLRGDSLRRATRRDSLRDSLRRVPIRRDTLRHPIPLGEPAP